MASIEVGWRRDLPSGVTQFLRQCIRGSECGHCNHALHILEDWDGHSLDILPHLNWPQLCQIRVVEQIMATDKSDSWHPSLWLLWLKVLRLNDLSRAYAALVRICTGRLHLVDGVMTQMNGVTGHDADTGAEWVVHGPDIHLADVAALAQYFCATI